jgi:NAD(P)-dependent dehydrogenase (short-subunit alcohol dehydrogenase family)
MGEKIVKEKIQKPFALVTGGARRIGKKIAVHLAQRGYSIFLHYHRSEKEAKSLARNLKNQGKEVIVTQCDLSNSEGISSLLKKAEKIPLEVVVLNASIFREEPWDLTPYSDWISFFTINFISPLYLSVHLGKQMKERGKGIVVFMGDSLGIKPSLSSPVHSLSKGGIVFAIPLLARYLAPEVRVHAIAPGPVLFPEGYPEEKQLSAIKNLPMKRKGEVKDILKVVDFLLDNPYLTGLIVPVDGGRSLL